MHLLRRSNLAAFLAPLAQRMGSDEAVTHTLPCSAILLFHGGVALVTLIALGFLPGVFLTESTVGQPRATWVGAGTLGSIGH